MKFLIVFATLAVAALALPLDDQRVTVTQDTAGGYKVSITTNQGTRVEERDRNGNVNGYYTYVDPLGVLRKIEYQGGNGGIQYSGDSIPVAPVEVAYTPEVAAARNAHLALFN